MTIKTISGSFLAISILLLVSCKDNSNKSKADQIDAVLQKYVDDKEFIGSVLIADSGKVIYKKSFGQASVSGNIDNSDTTRFLIGSVSKPLTALLILRLVEQNLIQLDERIDKHFTVSNPKIAAITVHHLLTHTSGLSEFINTEPNPNLSMFLNNAKIETDAGVEFKYNNSGYVLLAAIAEQSTGKTYQQLMQSEIFDVVGMSSSGVARNVDSLNLATGYENATQAKVRRIDFPLENVDGAGSVFSTVGDLFKLDRALYADKLLSKEMRDKMLTQHVSETYSYGWFVRERGGIWDVYFHQGNVPGFTAFITRRVQMNQFIILLANAENLKLEDIQNDISRILKRQD